MLGNVFSNRGRNPLIWLASETTERTNKNRSNSRREPSNRQLPAPCYFMGCWRRRARRRWRAARCPKKQQTLDRRVEICTEARGRIHGTITINSQCHIPQNIRKNRPCIFRCGHNDGREKVVFLNGKVPLRRPARRQRWSGRRPRRPGASGRHPRKTGSVGASYAILLFLSFLGILSS